MRKLVIAEKPSVAMSLSKVIGATKRQDGYLEGNGYLVSWCVGRLVEPCPYGYGKRAEGKQRAHCRDPVISGRISQIFYYIPI